MEKRVPLSTAETMRAPTSPRLKPSRVVYHGVGFTGGLVGGFSGSFNVPAVDTFIEKPFSALSIWVRIRSDPRAKSQVAARVLGIRSAPDRLDRFAWGQ
jgi:hypothetical protein